ncbi:MAG TPA: secretin N-terminal domain-containing protein [Gemmatimonadaceae bacterium]|nr:secretin N-terminal domain-containing protein [Gemmatimonadaceae bacterium]
MKPTGLAWALAASLLVVACATPRSDAQRLIAEGREEEALALLQAEAKDSHPARAEFYRVRDQLVSLWIVQADSVRFAQQYERAQGLYERVLKWDPANARAKAGVEQIETDKRQRAALANAERLLRSEKFAEAQDIVAPIIAESPDNREAQRLQRLIDERTARPASLTRQLRSSITKPVSLDLKDVPLRTVFDVLGRAANLNFLFDKDVRSDQKTTVVMRDAQVEDIIRLILATNQLDQKILNETTTLIYPNTPQKQRDYQELIVRTFYLVNADARQVANLIRTILKTRDIYVDEKLNLLTIKDTPNVIRLAEKLVASHDLAEPEVMLEIEVLEISANKLYDLGLRYPSSVAWSLVGGSQNPTQETTTATATTVTTNTAGTPGSLSLPEWLNRNAGLVRLSVTDPLFVLSLRQQDGSTNLLANPRVRVKNKEKAKIHIGDRVPVLTTTAAVTGGFVSQSVSYLDVGLKLDVEPIVYLNDDVGIKVGLEVSSITNTIQTQQSGSIVYQVGTRNANTVLRLRDGETQILAGLINDEDRRSAQRVPGLGDFPIIGRLFSSTSTSKTKTEIVLLITPHLMRQLDRPDARIVEFSAGTETSAGGGPLSGAPFTPPSPLPVAPQQVPVPPPAPAAPAAPQSGSTLVPFGGVAPPQQQ